MNLSFKIKHHFFNAFREIFVHHHGSLEFRAKIFALIISANIDANIDSFIFVKNYGLKIYRNDGNRANLLMLTTKEIEEEDGLVLVTADYTSFGTMHDALEDMKVEVKKATLERIANTPIEINEEQQADIDKILERLEDDEDVQKIYTNLA